MTRRLLPILCAAGALIFPAAAAADHSVGSASQIAWVRSAAGRFVAAELSSDGANACSILNVPLRGTNCQQRWDGRIAALLRDPADRARLRRQAAEIPSAVVVVSGNYARIELPTRLLRGPNRFLWTENCWMLTG